MCFYINYIIYIMQCILTIFNHGSIQSKWNKCLQGNCLISSLNVNFSWQTAQSVLASKQKETKGNKSNMNTRTKFGVVAVIAKPKRSEVGITIYYF